jgi:hypothetical protein
MPAVSLAQLEVIEKLTEPGSDGVLVRWDGGFWAPTGTPWQWQKDIGHEAYRLPQWSTTVQTVRAMERKGLLRRLYHHPEDWRDPRQITDAWLDLGLGELQPNKKSARVLEAERMQASGTRRTAQQKISRLREQIAALEAEKRAGLSQINTFARASRARTIVEPTTLVRGDRCQVVSEDRSRQLRAAVDAFYEAMRRQFATSFEDREQFLREDIDRTRDITAIQTKSGRRAASAIRHLKKRETEAESDDEVERNIDPGLLLVWRAVKRSITGSAKMDRTEAFQHWVEENPEEVIAILAEKLEPTEEEFQRGQAEHYTESASDDEIPF